MKTDATADRAGRCRSSVRGFEACHVPVSRGTVHVMVAGSGPPLLLLHGYRAPHHLPRPGSVGRSPRAAPLLPRRAAVWRLWATDLRGEALDATHFMAEDRPEETAAKLLSFLGDT